MNTPPPTPDPLVNALRGLAPAPVAVNRDRILFEAGAESRKVVVWLWQMTAGFMAAVGFAAGWYCRSTVTMGHETSIVAPAPTAPSSTLPPAVQAGP